MATGQIAAALGVLPGTVTSMLKTLDESNLATYTPYEGVRLTAAGRALALRVLRRHRLIEQFLSQTLNLTLGRSARRGRAHGARGERLRWSTASTPTSAIRRPTRTAIRSRKPTARSPRPPTGRSPNVPPGERFRVARVIDQSPEFLALPVAGGPGNRRPRLARRQRVAARQRDDPAGAAKTRTLSREAAGKLMVR